MHQWLIPQAKSVQKNTVYSAKMGYTPERMRGQQERSGSLFFFVSIEDQIPSSHPLRCIRKLADQALDPLNPNFCQLYASEGRPSVPPEHLLLASLLQAFYGIRSERLLVEQLVYNLLFR